MEKIISLAKRRGFVFPSSDIYGGLAGMWDYGPLGAVMKENIKREWWASMSDSNIYPLDSAIILNSKVWEKSGHLSGFSDPLVECEKCRHRFREDTLTTDSCPECGGNLTEPRQFNLMFKTYVGPAEDSSSAAYLRPETAQGIFVNFKNVVDSFSPKVPFGIAQTGKAFRNEITPRNFLFRMREFEQMELEYFCRPENADSVFNKLKEKRLSWFLGLGIKKENLRLFDYEKEDLAHYASATTDIQYKFGISDEDFSELEGVANRTDYDLKNHFPDYAWTEDGFVQKSKKPGFVPNVIEPSLGLDRAFLAFLMDAYEEEELDNGKTRTVLRLHSKLAPHKVAVFPLLSNKPEIVKKAREVYEGLLKAGGRLSDVSGVAWDDRGNIGKRYRSQDEKGTPFCITVDFDSLEEKGVTVRDRDTMEQERVKAEELSKYLKEKIK